MKNQKLNCVECGESQPATDVEMLVKQTTGMGPTCPKCVQQLNEAIEQQKFEDEMSSINNLPYTY